MRIAAVVLLSALAVSAQTLGQLRLVDFSARTPCTVTAVASGVNVTCGTPHNLSNGGAVWIYQPWDYTQNLSAYLSGPGGNHGRGYFTVTVADSTHFTLAAELYSGSTASLSGYGVAIGDKAIPLTTYFVRPGPKGWLDGPINKGAWSGVTAYRTHDLVTSGGNSYMAIADNTNQAPPNATYWRQLDPTMIGPGTFSASLRNTAGKANPAPAGGFSPYVEMKTLIALVPSTATYDYDSGIIGGVYGSLSSFQWFMDNDATARTRALRLATQTEDMANGSLACDGTTLNGYCGRSGSLDYARIAAWFYTGALSMVYDTLTSGQKAGLADRLLNGNDVLHNGIEASGSGCTPMAYLTGTGTIVGASYVLTGSGFSALTDLQPGSIIHISTEPHDVIGRVKSVDSDTHITLEPARLSPVSGASPVTYTSWMYTHPFAFGGAHDCGILWWLAHHPSSPTMITGQESHYTTDYPVIGASDASEQNNRTLSGLLPDIAAALILASDDIRAVRMAEQAINYWVTQDMAQSGKSRWTGVTEHNTQYGPGRVDLTTSLIVWNLKNSLTVTPPGVLTGSWIKNTLKMYQYAIWPGVPTYVQSWDGLYGVSFNEAGPLGGMRLDNISPSMMILSNLFPSDPFAAASWDYLRNRRGDFGALANGASGGWNSTDTIKYAAVFYDPLATATSPVSQPSQAAFVSSDVQECIAAGLYCRPDVEKSLIYSATGWSTTDTQVQINGAASLPVQNEDDHGMASNINILQNNGSNSQYLLGGNGLGSSGRGGGDTPVSGLYEGNTVSIFNAASGLDVWQPVQHAYQFARMTSSHTDNTYTYAVADLTPQVRVASTGYAPQQMSYYDTPAHATRVQRHTLHLKNGSHNANYVVVYDDVAASAANQLRAYWHYQIGDLAIPPVRHTDWITTYDTTAKKVVMTTPNNRLTTQILQVAGSANANVALTADNYSEAWCTGGQHVFNPTDSCAGNYQHPVGGAIAAQWTGTYRVQACASSDGASCDNETAGEWITVHKPSTSTTDTMPTLNQPACTGTGGSCTALEILDGTFPSVALIGRKAAPVIGMAVTTTHTGTANYVVAGVTGGHFAVTRNGVAVTSADVPDGDNSFGFSSLSGAINVTGGPVLTATPSTLAIGCTISGIHPSPSTAIAAVGVALDNWSATKTQTWLSLSPSSGSAAGTLSATVNCDALTAGSYSDTITISTTTATITNSPITVPVSLTVYNPPSITTASFPHGQTTVPYSQALSATGGQTPYAWDLAAGSLCNGLTLSSSGIISGTPTTIQTCSFTARVTEAGSVVATRALVLAVDNISTPGQRVSGGGSLGGGLVIK